jgi:hypothetical protein
MTNVLIEEPSDAVEAEGDLVLLWRREQFGRLGFGPVDARLLAESGADLGQARRLFTAGCPLDLAFRILA